MFRPPATFGKEAMISCTEAQRLIGEHPLRLSTERVALAHARGRVLGVNLTADRDGPPFHRVAMDGIAIASQSYQSGQRQWPCEGMQAAGSAQMILSTSQNCLEAMTGAPLPQGCDAVIPFEKCQRKENDYYAQDDLNGSPWTNIHLQASDFKAGQVLLRSGKRIRGPETAVAASLGYAELEVYRNPKIAIITTGSELVDVEDKPLEHQIRKSNIHACHCALLQRGFDNVTLFHVGDNLRETEQKLGLWLSEFDVLILSGGVSKGKLDFVPQALENLGVQKVFHKIAQKPGKPMWFGHREEHLVFALPGNPVSMLVCLEHYVLPHLDACMGSPRTALWLPSLHAVKARPSMTQFKNIEMQEHGGQSWVSMIKDNGSGDFASLCGGDGFMVVPPAESDWPAGTPFLMRPWS
jgi:molybdopterin molybdotransferase